jgi:hypothetical protein
VSQVVEFARVGERMNSCGAREAWRALRRQLAGQRALFVVPLGTRLFLLPAACLPRAQLIGELAHAAAQQDPAASLALRDLLADCDVPWGEDLGALRTELIQACCRMPKRPVAIPGGDPWREKPAKAGKRTAQASVGDAPPRRAGLSKLQRSILRFALDCCGKGCSAPLDLIRKGRTRSDHAVFSRALARLEARGLIVTEDSPGGRAQRIRLTAAGREAAPNG